MTRSPSPKKPKTPLPPGALLWLGIMFPACIFTCAFLGTLLDRWTGKAWGVWAGLALGIIAAYYNLYQTLREAYEKPPPAAEERKR